MLTSSPAVCVVVESNVSNVIDGTTYLAVGVLVVFHPEMRDLLFAHHPTQRVLELRLLNEQIMLGIEARSGLRALKIEGQPFLDARQSRARREVEEQREIEYDGGREN